MRELVHSFGPKKWAVISRTFKEQYNIQNKTGKQCRERWNNNLNPKIIKDEWTAQEEKILFEKHKVCGNKWSEIAKFLKGRTDNSTKNHFYSIVRKNQRKFNKNKPDAEKIKGNVKDLLEDPAITKILLKKPRHYHNKRKAQNQVDLKSTPKGSSTPKKAPAQIKLLEPTPRNSIIIEDSAMICCPTPIVPEVSSLLVKPMRFSKPTNLIIETNFNSPPEPVKNSEILTCRSSFETALTMDIEPENNKYPKTYFDFRTNTRENSFKSVISDNDFFRNESRKNSEIIPGFNAIRNDSRKPSYTNGFEVIDSVQNNIAGVIFPDYTLNDQFEFYQTPKNQRL